MVVGRMGGGGKKVKMQMANSNIKVKGERKKG